ncbi:PREDICTED: rap guanine nucleotide exchange factor 1-like [Thamnophis sirtalis]|uniref:Rap guanine nucleotide exchange factor 1-like n=1 Tax=Thamnophis sirtalis TaxID=35019 RepID=A0A6I9YXR9_9SAUR|nr:PREDICTED: rap guanine nucleotide exchange factor 1-like [Thamnophis sirtalis]
MLEGINVEDKEVVNTVKGVIKAVLDGVKELVKLTIEKQEHPSPTSPVKPTLPVPATDSQLELPLTDREMEILNKTAGLTPTAEVLADATDEEVAPPKPPLPCIRVAENSPPPALPPKKRQSAPPLREWLSWPPLAEQPVVPVYPLGSTNRNLKMIAPPAETPGGAASPTEGNLPASRPTAAWGS